MNKLLNRLISLFRKSELKSPHIPFLHETIDIDSIDHHSYSEWIASNNSIILRKRLKSAFLNFKIHRKSFDPCFEFWHKPTSKGFILFNHPDFALSKLDFIFFQYDIFCRLKNVNYNLNLADVQSRVKANWIEMIRRFYLKPANRNREGNKSEQLYGNIHLEYFERNDSPYMFRLLANTYMDQNFHKKKDFNELLEIIVSQ